jgi:hypothetical protein
MPVTNGRGVIDLHLGCAEDVELIAKGTIQFHDPVETSVLDVHLRFRAGERLRENDPVPTRS